MGKVRLKTIGDETQEKEEQKKLKEKREQKNLREFQDKDTKVPGTKGGEKVVSVGPSEEELAKLEEKEKETTEVKETKKAKSKFKTKKLISKRYSKNKSSVADKTFYPLKDAVSVLKKFEPVKFDETIELHINVKEKGVSGQVALPHGTGKTLKISIADDAIIGEIEKGKINFDVLVATPEIMPKLGKVARVLGPRGLMPSPKSGTISQKPEEVVKKLSKGQISYKTESQAPVIHLSIGKLSFDEKQILENAKEVLSSIKPSTINSLVLKSTMSPGIKIDVSSI